jgi:hypothetical protein
MGGGGGPAIAYRRQFQHDDWFDGSDRVSAGGPRGFNGKFHSLESEFDTISATVADIANAIALLDVQSQGKNIMIGNVGINNPNPQLALDVTGAIRQNRLALSGGDNNVMWSSLTYNNYHNAANADWVWPDLSHPSVTLEMDDGSGSGRFDVWMSAKNAKDYKQRFGIDGATGNVVMAINGGLVGIGTNSPQLSLDIIGRSQIRQNAGQTDWAGSAGFWYYQNTPAANRAFLGMANDNLFGLYAVPAADWVSVTDVTTGYVGINKGASIPTNPLHIAPSAGIRQGYLYLSGGAGGSSISYNAYRNPAWTFPDSAHESLTIEFDDLNAAPRFQIYRRPPGGNWDLKYALDASTGDVTVVGKLGTSGWSPLPRHTDPQHINLAGGIHTWDIEVEGTFWCGHDILGMGAVKQVDRDLAENFTSMTTLEPGDVVCLDPGSDNVVRAARPNDTLALGVVSTKPGFLLNAAIEEPKPNAVPVILSGRCPCKVVDENGPIRRGDLLTSSSTPGHAMKAKPITVEGREFVQPGTIIGKALGTLESGRGAIDIFAALA